MACCLTQDMDTVLVGLGKECVNPDYYVSQLKPEEMLSSVSSRQREREEFLKRFADSMMP